MNNISVFFDVLRIYKHPILLSILLLLLRRVLIWLNWRDVYGVTLRRCLLGKFDGLNMFGF